MNLHENILRIREMMGMDDSRLTFDIQKLVDDGIIFVTERDFLMKKKKQ